MTFKEGVDRKTLDLKGDETIDVTGMPNQSPHIDLKMIVKRASGTSDQADLFCRIDTADEAKYFHYGSILQCVLRGMAKAA